MEWLLNELDAILAMSIKEKKIRLRLVDVLTRGFAAALGPAYKIVHVSAKSGEAFENKRESHYYYIFDTRSTPVISEPLLKTVISLTEKAVVSKEYTQNDIDRLVKIRDAGYINLELDQNAKIARVELKNCVLLIRLSDHNYEDIEGENDRKRFLTRKRLVDDIHYYNMDDVEKMKEIVVKGSKNIPTQVLVKGKQRVLEEFEQSLILNKFDPKLITILKSKVEKAFN